MQLFDSLLWALIMHRWPMIKANRTGSKFRFRFSNDDTQVSFIIIIILILGAMKNIFNIFLLMHNHKFVPNFTDDSTKVC